MIGNNKLELNEGTMIIIVQQWIDREMPIAKPKVKSVKGGGGNYDYQFVVMLESSPPPASEVEK